MQNSLKCKVGYIIDDNVLDVQMRDRDKVTRIYLILKLLTQTLC